MTIADTSVPATLGIAHLARLASDPVQLPVAWEALAERATADPGDSGAWLDLSTLLQLTGNRDKGLEVQAAALAGQRCYRKVHGRGGVECGNRIGERRQQRLADRVEEVFEVGVGGGRRSGRHRRRSYKRADSATHDDPTPARLRVA